MAPTNSYKIKIDVSDAVVMPKNSYLFVFASPVDVSMSIVLQLK